MISPRRPRDPKCILIGMAIGNGTTRWETSLALISLLVSGLTEYEFAIVPMGGCDIAHARNLLIHAWHTQYTHCGKLLFIDSDVKFTADDIFKIISKELDIVGGLYPLSGNGLRWSYNGWSRWSPKYPELWEVQELCTGFMCISWNVIEHMLENCYWVKPFVVEDWQYRGETAYEFFWMGVHEGRRFSEDFYFSMRAREAGFDIYVDPQVQLDHIKTVGLLSFILPDGKTKLTLQEMKPNS